MSNRVSFKNVALTFFFFWLCQISYQANAAYTFQTVAGENFDIVTTDVVWTNDPGQTDYPIDDDYQLINIGFTFYLGEVAYTQVRILGNGALHFGADQGFHKDYTNEALPITGFISGPGFEEAADRAILGYWDDLEPSLGGTVRYDTFGSGTNRRFVASWENVPRYNGPGTSYSFQIVIFENGDIRFRYGNDQASGSSATIGIEVDDTDFTQYSFGANSVNDTTDILWTREFPTINSVTASCIDPTKVTVVFNGAISPARAAVATNFTINNGINVISSSYINSTTVELTTDQLSINTNYNLSTIFPTQSASFQLGTLTTTSFTDNFSAAVYSNNDGTGNWSGDWIESVDDGTAASGRIMISAGELLMNDRPNSGGEPTLAREVDLSSFTSASFSFDYRTFNNLENSDRFDVEVSNNGGANYTVLRSYVNDVNGSDTFDITAFISSNTRIRLRIENNYGGSSEYILIDNVTITGSRLDACTPAIDHFVISHDGSGINCLREPISITAVDSSGSTVTDYEGLVSLALATNNGNWFSLDESGLSGDLAQGTLTDTAGDNDGAASYQFASGDLGNVVLYLQNTVAETTNISVTENSFSDDDSEGNIIFRPFGFVFSPSPINTQIAGRPFSISLTAAGQTPAQSECGVIEEYTGVKSLNFWSDYNSPLTSATFITVDGTNIATSEATSFAQNVTFTTGVANLSTQYNDVGQIAIHAKDEIDIGEPPSGNLDEIIGGISPFIVRPFGFDIQITSDPFADDGNDSVYGAAGSAFNMTLRSVLWQAADDLDNDGIPDPFIDTDSDAIPDSGGDLSDNNVTANISQVAGTIGLSPTALVITNSNGTLSTSSINFSNFIASGLAGVATYTFSQSWDEVGILQVDALNNNFLGGGENVIGQRINIGRFVPDHFLMSAPVIVEQCGTFTYGGFFNGANLGLTQGGQSFAVSGTITARNTTNGVTQNYAGAFAKLVNTNIASQAYDTDAAAVASGRVNFTPGALNFVNGVTSFIDPAADYQFSSLIAPYNLRLDLTATDSDSVTSGTVNSTSFEVRKGRMRLIDAFGPETSDLEMRLFSDYFDGTQWLLNSSDSCSTYIAGSASFNNASYTGQLNAGETALFAPLTSQTLTSGISPSNNGLWFSAPGANNFGSVQVEFSLGVQPWLEFDWDSDNSLDKTTARLNFGYYRGSDRLIYWKELRN